MGEYFLVEPFLKLDHVIIEIVHPILVFGKFGGIFKTVGSTEFPGNVQLKIHIDSLFFELGEEIVEAFQLNWFNKGILDGVAAFRCPVAYVMHTDDVDSVAAQFNRQFVGGSMVREAASHSDIGSYKPPLMPRFIFEMVIDG